MGAARQFRNGVIPPTKEVHRYFEYGRNADFVRRLARALPSRGATQLLLITDNFLPGRPVGCVENRRPPKRSKLLLTFSMSIRPAHTELIISNYERKIP